MTAGLRSADAADAADVAPPTFAAERARVDAALRGFCDRYLSALEPAVAPRVIGLIRDGSVLFAYHPTLDTGDSASRS